EHRGHEQRQRHIESRKARRSPQIGGRVEEDRATDAGNQQREGERQPVEPEGGLDAETRYPAMRLEDDPAPRDLRQQHAEAGEEDKRYHRHKGRGSPASPPDEQRGYEGEGDKGEEDHRARLPFRRTSTTVSCQMRPWLAAADTFLISLRL